MRDYPAFLFSNPQNTKTTGPFIVHNLFPKAIIKVSRSPFKADRYPHASGQNGIYLTIIAFHDEGEQNPQEIDDLFNRAHRWLKSQLITRQVQL